MMMMLAAYVVVAAAADADDADDADDHRHTVGTHVGVVDAAVAPLGFT